MENLFLTKGDATVKMGPGARETEVVYNAGESGGGEPGGEE